VSCGCFQAERAAESLRETATTYQRQWLIATGTRFGRLVVVGPRAPNRHRTRQYRCLCDCGAEAVVPSSHLLSGNTASCGCLQRESRITHGWSTHPLHKTWRMMHDRCKNPASISFPYYGARGIRVDPRWDDFPTFLADMGPKPSPSHTLDRTNNDGPYAPENCRWATPSEQRRNQNPRSLRRSSSR
jgi:hypothetical protein